MEIGNILWDNIRILFPLFLGILGALILFLDLRTRRRLQKEDLDFRKKQFDEEKEEREERRKWLQREALRLTAVAEPLAEYVSKELKKDSRWLSEALERAKIGSHAQSIFTDRLGHFREEKEFLADHFVPMLLGRCKSLVTSGKKVYLLIDSGTTLYPFFGRLAREAVRFREDREKWIDDVIIATNNLPGVQRLMEVGRVNPNNRYSPLAIECVLFPGVPLPIYSAVTGKQTNDAVQRLRNDAESKKNIVFIALVVGNWIRLRRSTPNCPVPLARGTGHLEFKQTLIDNADEIYIVTPLGKVFINVPPDEINKALGFGTSHTDPDKQPYYEVLVTNDKARSVKMVSTSRMRGRVLSELSTKVQTLLETDSLNLPQLQFESLQSNEVPHILFPFDKLPDDWFLQIETEFPHSHTQREDLLKKYFFVPIDRRQKV
jgi:hypothetical protein